MANVFDVAALILERQGPMTAMKLQKLVYYSQAWSLVWDEELLFEEQIQAWANGPVCPALFFEHQGNFKVSSIGRGDPKSLNDDERTTVVAVLDFYGDKTSQWLSELSHSERPWKEARAGLEPGARGDQEITPAAMAEYYESL